MTVGAWEESFKALQKEMEERDCRLHRFDGNKEGLPTHFELAR